MKPEEMSFVEFVKAYWKDSDVVINPHFLAFIDEIEKYNPDNVPLIINSGRGFSFEGYKYNLVETAKALLSGKNVILVARNPISFCEDLEKYLDIKILVDLTENKDCVKLTLDK